MGTELAQSIVFSIEDELTDEEGFQSWWYGLTPKDRSRIRGFMTGVVDENIEKANDV